MLRAWDFEELIFRLDICRNRSKSLSRFGIEVSGSLKNSRMSSAKAAILYVCPAMGMPLMFSFDHMQRSRGSRVKIKKDRG